MWRRLNSKLRRNLRSGPPRAASLARRAVLLLAGLWYGLGASGGGLETLARAALGPSPRRDFPCSTHECGCRTAEGCLKRCCCSDPAPEAPAAPARTRVLLTERCS